MEAIDFLLPDSGHTGRSTRIACKYLNSIKPSGGYATSAANTKAKQLRSCLSMFESTSQKQRISYSGNKDNRKCDEKCSGCREDGGRNWKADKVAEVLECDCQKSLTGLVSTLKDGPPSDRAHQIALRDHLSIVHHATTRSRLHMLRKLLQRPLSNQPDLTCIARSLWALARNWAWY